LLINGKNGTFSEQGTAAGVAVGTDGNATGSMGVDIATPFNDGRVTIAVGCFAGQELSLFEAQAANAPGDMLFDNRKREAGIADPTHAMTTFGLAFADVDLDGWPDLLVLNGHIDADPSLHVSGGQSVPYRQKPQLFQNRHDGTFRDVAESAGIATPLIGRGLAVGDYDNDGRPDLLVFENGGPARLWHNETKPVGSWLGVELFGSKSPRDGTGAVVTLSGPGWTQSRFATTARSYLSACDPRLHFGLGPQKVEQLTVRWPSGKVTTLASPPVNRYLKVEEGR
ncbi:MAG TPA: CRTAC1 family protein, partial [Chthonomonadaceae bacterium]|nr:CRTAC1 family protein [Chthonomonadaceae bacterium]